MRYLTTFRTGSPHSDFLQSKFNLDRQYEVPNTMMKSDLNVAEKKLHKNIRLLQHVVPQNSGVDTFILVLGPLNI